MPTETPIYENDYLSYRIANGKIAIGRESDGTLEERDDITGFLLRVGYIEGVNEQTQKPFAYVECDLENSEGRTIRVKSAVGGETSSNVAPTGFALGLLACKERDDISIKPKLSNKPDPVYHKYSTYVNVYVQNPATLKYRQIGMHRDEFPGATSKEKWPHVLEALKKHECYAERPNKEDEPGGENVDLSIFATVDSENYWPSPFGKAKDTYLELLSDMAERKINDYDELSKAEVEGFAAAYAEALNDRFDDNNGMPELLVPFMTESNSKKKQPETKPKGFGK